ncbi:MAG: membrane protein insertase YidC [Spirochaetales bacterium]|nr:membrane protein insertase YidC [Spirochaetales bacterium]
MDKKSILAIILCVVVIMAGSWYSIFKQSQAAEAQQQAEAVQAVVEQSAQEVKNERSGEVKVASSSGSAEPFHFETDLFDITFDPAGASVSSILLKAYTDNGETLDLIFKGEGDHNAFLLYLGDNLEKPVTDVFNYTVGQDRVIFTQTFTDSGTGNKFTVTKTFQFKQGDYMFKVSVDIVSDSPLDFDGYAYTLGFEPQIGPTFTQMKNDNYNYRRFYISSIKSNGKNKKLQAKLTKNRILYEDPFSWVDLTGKYFSVVAMPEVGQFDFIATQSDEAGVPLSSNFFLARNSDGETTIKDEVYYYCGPQLKKYLSTYYVAENNAWGLRGRNLDTVADGASWLGWLETVLKWFLDMFYAVIPNYGVAIILTTVLIKLLTYPLTRKSTESSAKMAMLAPKMEALKERYKDNQEKLNQATMELYKEEGVNPMGGCLPLLIQFPILIAFYGLLNKHFELRGAMFIPGWIPDLSIPDTVLTLGFNIPLLGNQIHLLPILYTISMIYSSKLTSANNNQQSSMKFMTYGLPIIFFFVLYNAPSGLILYWSMQNLLSMLMQVYMNKRMKEGKTTSRLTRQQKKEEEAKVPEAIRRFEEKKRRQALEAKKPAKKK